MSDSIEKKKKRVFDIIQIGNRNDVPSTLFDIFIVIVILINLFITFFDTFDESVPYKDILDKVELITILIFTVEYVLRVWTAEYLYPKKDFLKAKIKFIFSFNGIVDLLTFFPYYLPVFFPAGAVAFRMLRVVRIFRLFRINSQYDAFNVILNVLNEKKNQLVSSLFMIVMLMVASSLCMYSIEHNAQPEAFQNAFSGIWWSVSTLLTVGYGDIYPVTTLGKFMAIVIAFLGVGMVAVPTGIISAGFVEHYSKIKQLALSAEENDIHFITILVNDNHNLKDVLVKDANLPQGLILALIVRNGEVVVPKGDIKILKGDRLVIGAEKYVDEVGVRLREVLIKEEHPWIGIQIKDLDISRLTTIVMIRRKNKTIIPTGNTMIKRGDMVTYYSKKQDVEAEGKM
ncbi:MAG: ion transporter [Lachnospiraceae bacterium]|nr:ion transporter [Lachnospiraceae bacterium]